MGLGGTQKEELARDEGEPIGSGLLENDTVDQVVKPFESYGLKLTVRWWSGSAQVDLDDRELPTVCACGGAEKNKKGLGLGWNDGGVGDDWEQGDERSREAFLGNLLDTPWMRTPQSRNYVH